MLLVQTQCFDSQLRHDIVVMETKVKNTNESGLRQAVEKARSTCQQHGLAVADWRHKASEAERAVHGEKRIMALKHRQLDQLSSRQEVRMVFIDSLETF